MRKHCTQHDRGAWTVLDPVGLALAVGSGFTNDGAVMDEGSRRLGAALLAEVLNQDPICHVTPELAFDLFVAIVHTPGAAEDLPELFGLLP